MALRSKAMQGLARRVMAPQSMLPARSGGGGPVALGRPPVRPVRLLFQQMYVPGTYVRACHDEEHTLWSCTRDFCVGTCYLPGPHLPFPQQLITPPSTSGQQGQLVIPACSASDLCARQR